jgi:hypothetical protein
VAMCISRRVCVKGSTVSGSNKVRANCAGVTTGKSGERPSGQSSNRLN